MGTLLTLAACGEEETPITPPPQYSDATTPVNPGGGDAGQSGGMTGGSTTSDAGGTPGMDGSTPKPAEAGAQPATDGGGSPATDSQWCKVKKVFDSHCQACHDGTGTGPMKLVSYADLTADSKQYPGTKIFTRVGVRMSATDNKMMPPQGGVPAADIALVNAWVAAGAPQGASTECASTPAPTGDGGVAGEKPWPACDETHKLLANGGGSAKFRVRKAQFYQNFDYRAPWGNDMVGVAFRPIVDNKKVLHHYIVYTGTSSFLDGWSPGKQPKILPDDIGVFLPGSGAAMRMTVHYYNTEGTGQEEDASGVEICLLKKAKRAKTAFTFPFAAHPSVPANANMIENKATCTVRKSTTEPIHLITSSPHMHGLGVGAKLEITRANGTKEMVHNKAFNFEEQLTYPIDVVLNDGDKVTTTCVFTNKTSRSVTFGQFTEDEMCFNFALYYPMCGMTCSSDDVLAGFYQTSQGNGCPR